MSDNEKGVKEAFFDKYFDISEVLIEYYTNQPTTGIERHFVLIEDFLAKNIETPKENLPLIIQCEEDFGVKTLLVKWMLYHKKKFATSYPLQDIILPYFVTAAEKKRNYFFAIFRFLMVLREKLNIKQKVELLEDKLRKFFGYWLGVCDRKIEKKIIKQKISQNAKIILLIHKIDSLIDPQIGKASNIGFWLPKNLPPRVRVIATCAKDSEAMSYFLKTGCTLIRAQNDRSISEFMIEVYSKKESFSEAEHKQKVIECLKKIPESVLINPKFLKTFISCLIPYPDEKIVKRSSIESKQWINFFKNFDYNKLEKLSSNVELIDFLLDYYEKKIMPLEKFRKLMLILSICYKGLMFSEILQLVSFTEEEWNLFLAIFKRFIIKFKGLFCSFDSSFKQTVLQRYSSDNDLIILHEEIATILDKTPLSTRKLEEQTYHLFTAKSYFRLKETVSIIENFLLLFNPHNKFDFCHYWEKLLENGFDPAVEYNKAIEGFAMHFRPSSEDIFQIILQISRFLKEFSDFETENTPNFKHPPISGFSELSEIGLEKEIINVGMYMRPDTKRNHQILSELEGKNMEKNNSHEEFRQHYIDKLGIQISSESQNSGNEILIVESPEELVPSETSFDEDQQHNNNINASVNSLIDLKSKIDNNISSINNIYPSQINNSINLKDEVSKLNLMIHEEKPIETVGVYHSINYDKAPTYYYYKRWLWMIFPWACMGGNKHCNYSEIILQCYSSATSYISVDTERKFTERALKIALDAKLKKKMMYAKKEELGELLLLKNMKPSPSQTLNKKKHSIAQNSVILEKKVINSDNNSNSANSDSNDFKFTIGQKKKGFESVSMLKAKKLQGSAFFITEELQGGNNTLDSAILMNRSKIMELKFREYNPENLMYLNKSLEESSLIVLPKLKNSIIKHSDDELSLMERKVKRFKDQFDSIVYMNFQLEKELNNLQKMQSNQNNKSQELIISEMLMERISDLEKILGRVDENFDRTNLQKKRVSMVLYVCKYNKKQNEEYIRSLNFLLQNFKKCIKMEIEDIKKNKTDIAEFKKLSNEMIKGLAQKLDNHDKLVHQIKNNLNTKMNFSREYDKTDHLIENSMLEAFDEIKNDSVVIREKREMKKIIKKNFVIENTTKSIGSKLEQYEVEYEKLKHLLNAEDDQFMQTVKFEKFLEGLDRKNELKKDIMEKEDKIHLLKEILANKSKIFERLLKNGDSEKDSVDLNRNQLHITQTHLERDHDTLCQNFVFLTKSKLAANSIFKKCEIENDKNDENNFNGLKEKIQGFLSNLKEKISAEDYEKLIQGKYQMIQVYKRGLPKDGLVAYVPDFSDNGLP